MSNDADLFPEIIDVLLPYPLEEIESFCDCLDINPMRLNTYLYLVGMLGFLESLVESRKGQEMQAEMARALSDMLLEKTENEIKRLIGGGEIDLNAIKEAIRAKMLEIGIKCD